MTFDHAQSPRLGQPTPVENPGVQLVTLETLPEIAYRGQIVYLLDHDEFRVYDGVAWQIPTAATVGGLQTFVGQDPPVADHVGDLWMNNVTFQLSVWNGTAWVAVVDPTAQALATNVSLAMANAEAALNLASGKTTIWYLPTQPVQPDQAVAIGDYWINTVSNKLFKFTTLLDVVEIQDQDIAAAINAAGTAQATADQKINTYTVLFADAPTDLGAVGIGDILFAVDQGNKPYRWDGDSWVELPATEIANTTVTSSLTLTTGSTSHVATGANIQLDGSVPAPSTGPTYTHDYPQLLYTLKTVPAPAFPGPYTFEIKALEFDSTNMWIAVNQFDTGSIKSSTTNATTESVSTVFSRGFTNCNSYLYRYSASAVGASELNRYNFGFGDKYRTLDFSFNSTYIFLLQQEALTGNYYVRRINKTTMAYDGTFRQLQNEPTFAISANETNVHIAHQYAVDGTLRIKRLQAADLIFIDELSSGDLIYDWLPGMVQTSPSVPGISSNKFITSVARFPSPSQPTIQSYTPDTVASTATRVAEEAFNAISNSRGGIAHDGTYFYQLNPATAAGSFGVSRFTNDVWTLPADSTRWASAAYRAVNSTTQAEMYLSSDGPFTKITARKRARLNVTAPTIPPGATGLDGDPNAVAIYLGKGISPPLNTGMFRQAPVLGIGVRTAVFDTPPVFSGTNPLTIGTFPTTGVGRFYSEQKDASSNPYIDFKGDGSWRLGHLKGNGDGTNADDTGWVTWTSPGVGNDAAFPAANITLCQYRRIGKTVHIRYTATSSAIKDQSASSDFGNFQVATNVPSGVWPSQAVYAAGRWGDAPVTATLSTGGLVQVVGGVARSYASGSTLNLDFHYFID